MVAAIEQFRDNTVKKRNTGLENQKKNCRAPGQLYFVMFYDIRIEPYRKESIRKNKIQSTKFMLCLRLFRHVR